MSVLSACARESSRVPQFGVALVIGNSAYAGVGALTNPKDDAALVAETLGGEGFKVTLLQDAKHDAMLKALRSFSDEADQADWALVYYAGHGIEVGGVNYLLPIDVELREDRDAEDEAISLDRVLRAVAKAHKLRLVVLDACRNNPFTGTMKRSIYTRGVVDRGLAPAEPPAGILVVYAAEAGQVAEDGASGHSPFTAALARRLILLCHKLALWQQGHRGSRRAIVRANLMRMLVMDDLTWRSVRIGGSAGSKTVG